jgi:hypothetical protein
MHPLLAVIAIGTQLRTLWAAVSHHNRKSPDQPSLRHGGDSTRGDGASLSATTSSELSLISPVPPAKAALLSARTKDKAVSTSDSSATSSSDSYDGFVPDPVLHGIDSVDCLEKKMQDVSSDCVSHRVAPAAVVPTDESYCSSRRSNVDGHYDSFGRNTGPNEILTISTYPHFSDECCHSGGEYFCDPDNLLTEQDQKDIQKNLNVFANIHPVQCPRLTPYRYSGISHNGRGDRSLPRDKANYDDQNYDRSYNYRYYQNNDNYDQRYDRSFWVGIALAKDLPPSESDPDSLQTMGLLLLSRWGLTQPLEVCSHAAMIIIVPEERVAHIATSSCDFICAERGGPEVVTAIIAALDEGGPAAAVRAGIIETGRVVKRMGRLAKRKW